MSATLEDSANAKFVYAGHSELTTDDLRYNLELDKEDRALPNSGKRKAGRTILMKKR